MTDARYSRQTVLAEIGPEGQQRLAAATVMVVGCGALGSVHCQLLARAGVGRLVVVDRDLVEESNLQRQLLYDEEDVARGWCKAEAAAHRLRRVNSRIEVEARAEDLGPGNVVALVADADVVLDGSDNFETRYVLNDACVQRGTPWVYGGVIGTVGMAMTILPGRGPCLRCVFPEPPGPGASATCDTVGVLNAAPVVIGGVQVAETIRLLVEGEVHEPGLLSLDLWRGSWRTFRVSRDPSCPCCAEGRYEYLGVDRVSRTTTLCGADAVQVAPPTPVQLDLEELATRLGRVAEVRATELLLRARVEGVELVVFADGRAIVRGTTDEGLARALYARFVGS
jgi:adenylyltransferase/sulfurtransferase